MCSLENSTCSFWVLIQWLNQDVKPSEPLTTYFPCIFSFFFPKSLSTWGNVTVAGAEQKWGRDSAGSPASLVTLIMQESVPRDYVNGARALPALPKVNPSVGQGSCLTGEQRSPCRGRGIKTRYSGLLYLRRLVFRMGRTQFKWCYLGIWWQSLWGP